MNRIINLSILGGMLLMAAVLIAVAITSREQLDKLSEARQWVSHSHEVIGSFYALRSVVEEAETGQRGFVITGESTYLEPYKDATARIGDLLDHLHALVSDNSQQSQRLDLLRPIIDRKLKLLAQTIDVRQHLGFDEARRHILTNSGNALMTEITKSISDAMDLENELLKDRTHTTELRAQESSDHLVSFAALAVVFQLFLIMLVAGFAKSRQRTAMKLDAVLSSMAEGVMQTDADGRIKYLNPAAVEILGYQMHEIRDKKLSQLIASKATADDGSFDLSKNVLQDAQGTVKSKSGSIVSIQFSTTPGDDDSCVISFQDVTETRRAEQRAYIHHQITNILAQAESLSACIELILQTCCEMLNWDFGAFWMVSDDGEVLRNFVVWHSPAVNCKEFADTSRTMEFALGQGELGRVWQTKKSIWLEDLREVPDFLRAEAAAKSEFHTAIIFPIVLGDKFFGLIELFKCEATVEDPDLLASLDSAASLIALFVERNRARDELIEREARTSAIFDTAADGIFTVAGAGIIESANKIAHTMFGFDVPELIGKNISLILPSFGEGEGAATQLDTGERKIGDGVEMLGRHKNGGSIAVELTLSIVNLGDRNIVTGIIRDIARRKEVERRVSELYSTISHELRTPLTSIRGSLSLLEGGRAGQLPERAEQLIKIARAESERLIRLINDILDIRKIQAGKLELHLEELAPDELINQTMEVLANLALEKEITLRKETYTGDRLRCDRDRIKQVLTNLVSNAIKFAPVRSKIIISVERTRTSKCKFAVSDEGPGIPADQLHKLFQLFQQVDASDTRSKEGTGLGLAISKAIVEQHGGTIGVSTASGAGSTFWFELPMASLDTPSRVVSDNSNPKVTSNVDDDSKLVDKRQ